MRRFFFQHERFPSAYAELQPIPLLKVGMLTYAGDDGREKGQAYRLALDLDAGVARFRFRYPDEAGVWHWRKVETIIPLPDCVKERLSDGELMAPTMREEHSADGQRFAVLDFIVLLLLSQVHGCSLLSMESLKTLKSTGRGKGVRGRWRNYRNNSTIRGEIWRLLRYKCHLVGLRFHTELPGGTSHTCPRCGEPAKTYRSPSDRGEAVKWGRWMYCEGCHYHGDRDYCASVNIARLGVAYLLQMKHISWLVRFGFLTIVTASSCFLAIVWIA